MSSVKIPKILNKQPEPKQEWRIFHRTKLLGWSGLTDINNIQGWANNRRIELFRRKIEADFGRPPTPAEIYDFMLSEPKFYIKGLASSILLNGIRVPLILAANGTLLDGNRRYVATRHAIEHNPDSKGELKNIPVWVLTEDATSDDIHRVLVECNFINDWREEWPNYIKAFTVFDDHEENHLSLDELSKRYALEKGEVSKMIKVMQLIQEFLNYRDNTEEAFLIAYEHYPFFEEAHNKFRGKLDADPDFKEQFFDWVMENKFRSYMQIRYLGQIRDNEEAWEIIRGDNKDAVDTAVHLVLGEKLSKSILIGGEKKVKKVIKVLRDLKEQEIVAISTETLSELTSTLTEIIRMTEAVIGATDENKGSKASG